MKFRRLTKFLFFGIVIIDTLGVVLPNLINREIITYFPIPILTFVFLAYTRFSKPLHIIALVFTFLGICFFSSNLPKDQRLGLVFYLVGIVIYIYNILKVQSFFKIESVVKFALLFLSVLIIPSLFYLDHIDESIFYPIVFYINGVGFLFYICMLSYVNNKTNYNKALLFSGILLAVSTIAAGYTLFIGRSQLFAMINIATFLMSHYFMAQYAILKS